MHRTIIPIDEIVDIKEILFDTEQEHKNPIKESSHEKKANPIKEAAQRRQKLNLDRGIDYSD